MGGGIPAPHCASASVVHPHRCFQIVVCFQVIVCISAIASDATIYSDAEDSGSDRAPLCLSQGDSAEVKGQDVGANGHRFRCRLVLPYPTVPPPPRRGQVCQFQNWIGCSCSWVSDAIESRISRRSLPLAARFRRAEASSKVMIKC